CSHGITILYISHHLEEIFRLADRITILRDGRLVTTQPTTDLTQGAGVNLMAGHDPQRVAEPTAIPAAMADADVDVPMNAIAAGEGALLEIRGLTAGSVLR